MLKQAHLYIKGDVTGVGFRAWIKIQAKIIGITGWVKNSFDHPDIFGVGGGVETLIQGDEEKINQIMEILKKGPPVSRVEEVEIIWQEPKEMFDEFKIVK
jgi:acylphosphatase